MKIKISFRILHHKHDNKTEVEYRADLVCVSVMGVGLGGVGKLTGGGDGSIRTAK